MKVEDLTDEMLEMLDSNRAVVWDGEYIVKRPEKPVDAFNAIPATPVASIPE